MMDKINLYDNKGECVKPTYTLVYMEMEEKVTKRSKVYKITIVNSNEYLVRKNINKHNGFF